MSQDEVRNARPVDEPPPDGAQRGAYQEGYNNSWALVVGIDRYENLSPLRYAVNDAKAVAALLQKEFGFKAERVFLRRDEEATKDEIEGIVDKFINETEPDDRVVIYFAGHGLTRRYAGGREPDGHLAPVGARRDEWRTHILTRHLTDRLDAAAAKHIFCIFDACFSGITFRGTDAAPPRYQGVALTRKARLALTAGLDDQLVRDGGIGDHSVFTHYLLEGLRGAARGRGDDVVTAQLLMTYVYEQVRSHPGSIQIPSHGPLPGNRNGDLLFISQAARLPLDLERNLESKHISVRRPAIRQLGNPLEPGNPSMLEVQRNKLAEVLLEDDLAEAREEAAQSFLRLADPLSIHILSEALFQVHQAMTSTVRAGIALALGQLKPEEAVEPLLRVLEGDDPQVQTAAALALCDIKSMKAGPLLARMLRSHREPAVRIAVARALEALADPATFDALEDALKEDDNVDVRMVVTRALGRLNNERAVYVLSRTVLGDSNTEVRRLATRALGQLQDARAVATLMIDLEHDRDPTVRSDAIKSIQNLSQLGFIDFITKALLDREAEIRRDAVNALGKLNHPRTVPPLRKALNDIEPSVRQAAVEALGGLKCPEAAAALLEALKDTDNNVRRYAIQQLENLGVQAAAAPLANLLKNDDDWSARLLAASALGSLGDAAYADDLFDAMQNSALKSEAALALGSLGDKRALEYLKEAMGAADDQTQPKIDAEIKRRAIFIAGELNAPELLPDLRMVLETSDDPLARVAAAEALRNFPPAPETAALLARVMRESGHMMVRAAAAESLGALGTAAYLKDLTDILANRNEPDIVRGAAAVGLGQLGDPTTLQALSDALGDHSDKVKLDAIVGLGYMKNPAVVGLLANVLLNKDIKYILRDAAAQELLESDQPGALDAILDALDTETDPTVLVTLVVGLGQLGRARQTSRVIDRFIYLLQNSLDDEVRHAAASVLGDIGDESAIRPLLTALEDENPLVAAWAVAALGKLEARQAVGELRAVYRNKERLQVWAAWAAGRLQDNDALNLFEV